MNYDYRETPEGIRVKNNPELYKKTLEFQQLMKENRIAWHNPFADECTDDFGCCTGKGDYDIYFPSYETAIKDSKGDTNNH